MHDLTFHSQLVGSYAKPVWIADHDQAYNLHDSWWRIAPEYLEAAKDDATRLAIYDQERAGLDVLTDGEERRQSFSAHFFGLGGIDTSHWGQRGQGNATDIAGFVERLPSPAAIPTSGPVVNGPITWPGPIAVPDFLFLKRHTRKLTKVTVVGPSTLATRLSDHYYGGMSELMIAIADAMNHEVLALEAAGADIIQIDDPEIHFSLAKVHGAATEALNRMVHGVRTRTAVHVCYGYARTSKNKPINPKYAEALDLIAASNVDEISLEYEQPGHQPDVLTHCGSKAVILGVLNCSPEAPIEQVDGIMARARAAAEVVPPEQLRLAPDCGMWFLPREQAFAKIAALGLAAKALQGEVSASRLSPGR